MKIASLLLNALNLLVFALSFFSLIPTAMLFDAPGSTKKKGLWFLFWMFTLFPLVVIGSMVVGWWKWGQGDYSTALKAGGVAPAYGAFAFICLFTILDK